MTRGRFNSFLHRIDPFAATLLIIFWGMLVVTLVGVAARLHNVADWLRRS
jgi:hypothetical protein